jgi:glutathione S-transferase
MVPSAVLPHIKLMYFDIEARGEPVRLALTLAQVPFDDVRVKFDEWPALKGTMPSGQLPVLQVDDGPMRTQSMAMLRWIGATYSSTLYPTDKLFDIEEAMGMVEDLDRAFIVPRTAGMNPQMLGYPEGYSQTEEGKAMVKKLRESFVQDTLSKVCDQLTKLIESHGGPFLVAGSEPTVVDCVAVPLLRSFTRGYIDYVAPTCLDAHPVVVKYIKDFCALEQMKGRYNTGIC